jgi:hypothetical protein
MYNPISEIEDSLHESIDRLKAIADLLIVQPDSIKEATLYAISRIMTDELVQMDKQASRLVDIRRNGAAALSQGRAE